MANIRRRSMMLMEGHSSLAFRIIVSEEAEVARKLFANDAMPDSRRFIRSPRRLAQPASVACPLRRGAAVAASVASEAAASVALAPAWGNPFNSLDHLAARLGTIRRKERYGIFGC